MAVGNRHHNPTRPSITQVLTDEKHVFRGEGHSFETKLSHIVDERPKCLDWGQKKINDILLDVEKAYFIPKSQIT